MLDSCDIVHAQELVFRLVSVHESKKFDAKLLARGAEPEQLDEIKGNYIFNYIFYFQTPINYNIRYR